MTIVTTSSETASFNFTFTSNNQGLLVQEGVMLVSDGASAVAGGSATGGKVYNSGSIVSLPSTIFGGIATGSDGYYIENEQPGKVSGAYAIYILSGGTHATILNKGDISGYITGIYSLESGIHLTNSGMIAGDVSGVSLFGSGHSIQNLGEIAGNVDGIALNIDSGAERVSNSGVVHGLDHAINVTFGTIMLKNLGTLDGDVSLSDGADRVTNTGSIIGDVSLGNGANIFNGRGGTVSGTIAGGAGIDKIFAGNDGEELAGGKGHDVLYGGAGADIFDFSSYAAADRDTVHGFSAANDHIQLDHTVFTHLLPDAAPVFAVAAASTGPTDFLFYNSATGGLYYDVDASGSHAPALFAMFDPGLNLTAANFAVV